MLRQRSRPYLFSNSIPPMVAAAGCKMVDIMSSTNELQDKLHSNTDYFVAKMKAAGFDIKPTESAICAVMLYDAKLSQDMAAKLQEEGIYVTGFYYPVVPKGQARIRVQISAAHEVAHLDKCIAAFTKVGKELGVIKQRKIILKQGSRSESSDFFCNIEDNVVADVSIFPNPTNDILNITSSKTISEIEIVNVLGQVVYRKEVNADNTLCDVNELTAGVYIVRIHGMDTESVICQRKFIKE